MANKRELTPDNKFFALGLKQIIRSSWPTQEEFAQGITSKVNMSNILRLEGGTSLNMRESLAKRAGLTVEEVIALGRETLNDIESVPASTSVTMKDPPGVQDASITEEEYVGGSANDIMSKVNEVNLIFNSGVNQYTQAMTYILRSIIRERDKLCQLLAQEQSVLNNLPSMIKVVDRNMNVISVNRTMMETFHITPGDNCDQNRCTICNGNPTQCVAKQTFQSGKTSKHLIKINGDYFILSAFPIVDLSWRVEKVILMVTPGDLFKQQLIEMGWTPPNENVPAANE